MLIFILNIFRKAPAISKTGEPGAFRPLAVQAVPIAANYMPSVLFFNVVSVPRIGTAGFEPALIVIPLICRQDPLKATLSNSALLPNTCSAQGALPLSYVPKVPGDLSRSGSAVCYTVRISMRPSRYIVASPGFITGALK